MAQCFRQGRGGAEPDEAMARELLRAAADAGSEPAREELEAQRPDPSSEAPLQDYKGMDLGPLKDMAEKGNLGAGLELFYRYRDNREMEKAKLYITRCVRLAMQGRSDLRLRREALEAAGDFYRNREDFYRDREGQAESRRLYELARELGSVTACGKLPDYYKYGWGGPADPELEEDCICQMERQGGPDELYRAAVWRANQDGASSLEVQDDLERAKRQAASEGGSAH